MKSLTQPTGKSGVLSYGLYLMYRKRFTKRDKNSDANVPYHIWLRICKSFNQQKMASIQRGHIFTMPFRLGKLGIVQFKRKIHFDDNGVLITRGFVPDWPKTMALWDRIYPNTTAEERKLIHNKQLVFHTNEHTDGVIFRMHWKKKYAIVKNISAYEILIPPHCRRDHYKYVMKNPNIQYCTKF